MPVCPGQANAILNIGMRGRPPKPKIEKLLTGDPGKRLKAAEKAAFATGKHPQVNHALAKPLVQPKTLSPAAKPIWKRVVASMPIATYAASDEDQIATYCEAVATYHLATAMLQAEGYIVEGSMRQKTVSPWFAIQRDARAAINAIGPTLYLTPASRQAMMANLPSEEEDDGVE
ncbi:phage terminase small subunit P27 family [uncultured Brevundimonas sp.]|uniref:phage terminase small subunit P27 family n=1 Tax=uncultured Brevundimonas sp. TaxID=213418 RepID=UPI0025F19A5F|nr:phage terminase small subunit P27 family [uncultured Brevundimonas sp.]